MEIPEVATCVTACSAVNGWRNYILNSQLQLLTKTLDYKYSCDVQLQLQYSNCKRKLISIIITNTQPRGKEGRLKRQAASVVRS